VLKSILRLLGNKKVDIILTAVLDTLPSALLAS
jgi:hypothetical protein